MSGIHSDKDGEKKIKITFNYKLKEEFLEARVKERKRAVINLIRNTYKSFR